MSSKKKSSVKKSGVEIPFKDLERKVKIVYYPTSVDLDLCEKHMEMKDMKDPNSSVFQKMPKSVFVHGRAVPRTALRKRDLCHLYLLLGGKIIKKAPKPLKHFTISKKKSKEQKKYEDFVEMRDKKDHKTTMKKNIKHESATKTILKNTKGGESKRKPVQKLIGTSEEEDQDEFLMARFKSMKIHETDTPSATTTTNAINAKKKSSIKKPLFPSSTKKPSFPNSSSSLSSLKKKSSNKSSKKNSAKKTQ